MTALTDDGRLVLEPERVKTVTLKVELVRAVRIEGPTAPPAYGHTVSV